MSKIRSKSLLLLLCAAVCLFAVSACAESCSHDLTEGMCFLEPTCTEKGIWGAKCVYCGMEIPDSTEWMDPLGHDYKTVEAVAPTCTQEGHSAYEQCSRCGDLQGLTILNPAGHQADSPVQENYTEGSCTQEGGYDLVVYCSVCGDVINMSHITTGGGEHNFGSSCTEVEPTCQHEGRESQSCLNCGYTEYWTLPRTDHVRGEGVEEKQVYPTCTAYGSYDYVIYCSVCGEEQERLKCNWKAKGHDWSNEPVVEQEPRLTMIGFGYILCANDSTHKANVTIPPLSPKIELLGLESNLTETSYELMSGFISQVGEDGNEHILLQCDRPGVRRINADDKGWGYITTDFWAEGDEGSIIRIPPIEGYYVERIYIRSANGQTVDLLHAGDGQYRIPYLQGDVFRDGLLIQGCTLVVNWEEDRKEEESGKKKIQYNSNIGDNIARSNDPRRDVQMDNEDWVDREDGFTIEMKK